MKKLITNYVPYILLAVMLIITFIVPAFAMFASDILYHLSLSRYTDDALCCASERLYVSTCRTDFSGGEKSPSEIIGQIKRILPGCKKRKKTARKGRPPRLIISQKSHAVNGL